MPGSSKEETTKRIFRTKDDESLQSIKQRLKAHHKKHALFSQGKVANDSNERDGSRILKKKGIVKNNKEPKIKISKKRTSLSHPNDNHATNKEHKNNEKLDNCESQKIKRRRRRKKRKTNVEIDEASRLQRRTKYLLIKLKLEQNLIDAYCAEGWRGQSREKIKPEKELERARKQILNCKLGIREAIHQLELLSSAGHTDASVAPNGSVHHEQISCSKCNNQEALLDGDIIHCGGTCKSIFHRNCLDSPLRPQNRDESWFCKFCKTKIEILEATNAHLGTDFPVDVSWQDVFKEEAALPDDENLILHTEEWPSDDSEDENYDPEGSEQSCSNNSFSSNESYASDCSFNFHLDPLENDNIHLASGRAHNELNDDENDSGELVSGPRHRAAVDYIKLNDEMFGKSGAENEQISDDEDWGPKAVRRRVKESDAANTLMTLGESDLRNTEQETLEVKEKMKKSINRLPNNAVEKLRLAFAENELPTREVRVSLSKQLSLEFDKVNKWFKNARYLALKARKTETVKDSEDIGHVITKESENLNEFVKGRNNVLSNGSIKIKPRKKKPPAQRATDKNKISLDPGDDVSLKHLKEKAKEAKKKSISKTAEAEMQRLCEIKNRVENLRRILLQLPKCRPRKRDARTVNSNNRSVVYIPVAEVREKR